MDEIRNSPLNTIKIYTDFPDEYIDKPQFLEKTASYGSWLVMMLRRRATQKGFSLLESVISVILIALLVNGLFVAWQFVENKKSSYDQYCQTKESLETAYEMTLRNIREAKLSTVKIINAGEGVTFTKSDATTWVFTRNNNLYQVQRDGVTETLFGKCNASQFQLSNNMVRINLSVEPPDLWDDTSDLTVAGNVFPRN